MVWTGVTYYGKTSLIFIDKGVKVNADYNINKSLKPFLTKDVPRMFYRQEKEMMFRQDSRSSQIAKTAIEYVINVRRS